MRVVAAAAAAKYNRLRVIIEEIIDFMRGIEKEKEKKSNFLLFI